MRRWPVLLIALLLLLPVAAAMPDVAYAAGAGPPLGDNLAGEACHADSGLTEARPVEIFCGGNAQSLGRMQVTALDAPLSGDLAARRASLLPRAKAIAVALLASEQLSCDGGQFLGESSDDLVFVCTFQSDSWPRLLLISASGRFLAQAEGLPSMLSVLAAANAAALGRQIEPAEIATGQTMLAVQLSDDVLKAGGTDMARYSQSIEQARIYSSGNDFAAAETALRGALVIDTKLFGPGSMPVGLALMELGLQVSNQGRFDEAAGLFRRASPIIEGSLSADARARLNSYLALDAANQRDFAKALAYAREATAERRGQVEDADGVGNAGFSGLPAVSSGELAHSLRIEAEMALRLNDLPAAEAAAEEALWIINLEPGLALWWRADVLALMAEVNERHGRVGVAERNYLDALALRQKLFGDSAPVVLSHLAVGRFYTDQQQYAQALDHFRAAMAILANDPVAQKDVVPDHITPFIAAAVDAPIGPAQRAILDGEIFRATQLVNSDVAGQAITRASVRLAAANPPLAALVREVQDAQRARDQLRIDLAAELAKSDDERNAVRETLLSQNLEIATARARQLTTRVQGDFPAYIKLSNPGPVELSDVRAQLRPGEAFLAYVIGIKGSYGLLVTGDGMTIKRLGVTAETLTADIAGLRRAFVPQLGQLPDFSLRNSYALYAQLLGPFGDGLKGIDHLVVAPGPVLANLPFSLLVSASPADGASYGDAAWLIRDMAVSQVPSPRAFYSLRQAEKTRVAAPRPFLGLGDPLLTGEGRDSGGTAALETLALSCREASPMPASLLRALAPLPDTAGEVNAVAHALGGDADSILLGAAASEQGLRAKPLDQYRVVYFATHGLLPGELHCQAEPGLVLSPPAQTATSTDSDGLLETSEVAALRLNADLVVLSACNTAAAGGGRFGGGALEGLADAFFNAGARGVLASHWEVPSAATAELMTHVFERYGGQERGRGLAEALRQAQLDLTRSPATAHPFYWAAFTLIGVGENGEAKSATVTGRPGQQPRGGTL